MAKYNKIINYIWNHGKKFNNRLDLTFGPNAFFSIIEIEEKIYAANLASQKIDIIKKKIRVNWDLFGWEKPIRFNLKSYEYLFFSSLNKVYSDIRYLKENKPQHAQELQELLNRIKHLKDQRDGLEHGNEDYWKIEKGIIPKQAQVERKKLIGDNFDFSKNMALLNEVYEYLLKTLSIPKRTSKRKL